MKKDINIIVKYEDKQLGFVNNCDFAKTLGINQKAVDRFLREGCTYQELVDKYSIFGIGPFTKRYKNISFEVSGVNYTYDKISDFAKSLNISESVVHTRLRDGLTYEQIFCTYIKSNEYEETYGKFKHRKGSLDISFEHDGIKYRVTNVDKFAREFGMNVRKLNRALHMGLDPALIIELLGTKGNLETSGLRVTPLLKGEEGSVETKPVETKPVEEKKQEDKKKEHIIKEKKLTEVKEGEFKFKDKSFKTLAKACKYYDVPYSKIYNRMNRKKCSFEEALNWYWDETTRYIVNNMAFKTHEEACDYFKVDCVKVKEYIEALKLTLEDAINKVLNEKKDEEEHRESSVCKEDGIKEIEIPNIDEKNSGGNREDSVEEFEIPEIPEIPELEESIIKDGNKTQTDDKLTEDKLTEDKLSILAATFGFKIDAVKSLAEVCGINLNDAFVMYINKVYKIKYIRSVKIGGEHYNSYEEAADKLHITQRVLDHNLLTMALDKKLESLNAKYIDNYLVAFKCPVCGKLIITSKYSAINFEHGLFCSH